jgi:hypothetical protein
VDFLDVETAVPEIAQDSAAALSSQVESQKRRRIHVCFRASVGNELKRRSLRSLTPIFIASIRMNFKACDEPYTRSGSPTDFIIHPLSPASHKGRRKMKSVLKYYSK